MKRTKQLLGAVSVTALVAMTSAPAMAEGIRAGTDITNNVSVTYDSGGVTQTAVTDSDTFAVDRRVNVVVASNDTANVDVTAGETGAVLSFDVTNLSNDVVDLNLSAAAGSNAGASNFTFFVDANGNGALEAGEEVTFLDEVEADETIEVFVLSDIGGGLSNGDIADVVLTATAHEADTGGNGDGNDDGTLGAILSDAGGDSADQDVVDTVFADGAGDTDAAEDGAFSDTGTYEVAGAVVTVRKSSSVISDPVNGTTDPKAIPGAVIEYCIAVSNASGADATNIVVTDTLPLDVEYDATFGILLNATATVTPGTGGAPDEAACTGGAADPGNSSFTDNAPGVADVVTGNLNDVSAGSALGLRFRVTIPAVVPGTPTT